MKCIKCGRDMIVPFRVTKEDEPLCEECYNDGS